MDFPNKFKEPNLSILFKRDAFFVFCVMLAGFLFLFAQSGFSQTLSKNQNNIPVFSPSEKGKIFNKQYFISLRDSIQNKNAKDSLISTKTLDTNKKNNEAIERFKMKKSPWLAVGLSAIFPGLGQFYNESYWKLPIIAFFTGLLGYEIIYNNSKFLDYRDKYAASQTPEFPIGDTRLHDLREFYRDQRDQNLLYFGLFYLIDMADAYVDAHLYDFSVSDKVHLGLFKQGKIANLKITF